MHAKRNAAALICIHPQEKTATFRAIIWPNHAQSKLYGDVSYNCEEERSDIRVCGVYGGVYAIVLEREPLC